VWSIRIPVKNNWYVWLNLAFSLAWQAPVLKMRARRRDPAGVSHRLLVRHHDGIMTAFRLQSIGLEGETSTTRALALLSQAGSALVAATGATATTTAARQLPRGRSRFRGEWEHTPEKL
jgi:hypothetical protein